MKRIYVNPLHLTEALNVAVDVKNNDVATALRDAKVETDKNVGAGVDRNYIVPGGELNEEDDVDNNKDEIISRLVNELFNKMKNDSEFASTFENEEGLILVDEVLGWVMDKMDEPCDESDCDLIIKGFGKLLKQPKPTMESRTYILTKKEINTIKCNALLENSIIFNKSDLLSK